MGYKLYSDCQYAYYVYCLAHQLQLVLTSIAGKVQEAHNFFQNMVFIRNIIIGSSQCHGELQASQIANLEPSRKY